MAQDLAIVHEVTIWEGQNVLLQGYLEATDGQPITTAIASTFDRYVYEADGGGGDSSVALYDLTNEPATNLIYDTIQEWDEDDRGYNYAHELEYTGSLEGGRSYIVELLVEAGTYGTIPEVWRVNVRNLRSI